MTSVPFHIAEVDHGFSEADGILRLEGDALVFEFQKVTMGLFKSEPRTVRVGLDDVMEIRHKQRRLLRDKVTITARALDAFAEVPGQNGGRVALLVNRRHREDVEALLFAIEALDAAGPDA